MVKVLGSHVFRASIIFRSKMSLPWEICILNSFWTPRKISISNCSLVFLDRIRMKRMPRSLSWRCLTAICDPSWNMSETICSIKRSRLSWHSWTVVGNSWISWLRRRQSLILTQLIELFFQKLFFWFDIFEIELLEILTWCSTVSLFTVCWPKETTLLWHHLIIRSDAHSHRISLSQCIIILVLQFTQRYGGQSLLILIWDGCFILILVSRTIWLRLVGLHYIDVCVLFELQWFHVIRKRRLNFCRLNLWIHQRIITVEIFAILSILGGETGAKLWFRFMHWTNFDVGCACDLIFGDILLWWPQRCSTSTRRQFHGVHLPIGVWLLGGYLSLHFYIWIFLIVKIK